MPLKPKRSFDEKCLELAEHFTDEPKGKWTKEDVSELAELIQRTIESFLCEEEDDVPCH